MKEREGDELVIEACKNEKVDELCGAGMFERCRAKEREREKEARWTRKLAFSPTEKGNHKDGSFKP